MTRKKIFLLLIPALLAIPSCMLGRFIWYNYADITDYKIFPSRTIETGDSIIIIPQSLAPQYPKAGKPDGKNEQSFEALLEANETVAFLILYRDSIHYEKYFDGYSDSAIVTSFSVAKSILSLLVGCAIEDGYLRHEETLVTEYLPELTGRGFDKVTILDLLQMTSGLIFDESYNDPTSEVARFYYGKNLEKQILSLRANKTDSTGFDYLSGNTQLLGLVLKRALKDISLSEYLERKLWKPLGMEYPATWSLDEKDGLEKAFCCLNARARDFAKIGLLMAHGGKWKGKQLVPEEWIKKSTTPGTDGNSAPYYQYQWWIGSNGDFLANGILGQYIYVHPAKNLVIVRMGKGPGHLYWNSVFEELSAYY